MKYFKPHQAYMQIATILGAESHCIKKQVGVVIVKDHKIVSTGYNSPPPEVPHCDEEWPEKGCKRSLRGGCFLSIHAEQNAILYALKSHIDLTGATLYVTLSPCLPCARLILGVGIKAVWFKESYASYKKLAYDEGVELLNEFDIATKKYTGEEICQYPPTDCCKN